MKLYLLFGTALLGLGMAATVGANAEDALLLAEKANGSWTQALTKGSAPALASTYTEDAIVTAPTDENLESRKAIENYWSTGISQGNRYYTDIEAATVQGSSLFEAGIWSAEIKLADGKSRIIGGNLVRVLDRQDDGSWKIRLETWHRHPR